MGFAGLLRNMLPGGASSTSGGKQQTPSFDRNVARLPTLVVECVERLESCLSVEGLFRVSGLKQDVDALKEAYDKGNVGLASKCNDPHAVSGALKLFFRELPDPLLTAELYDSFIAAMKIDNPDEQWGAIVDSVNALPAGSKALFSYVFAFLTRVTQHSAQNKMSPRNLAIVFAPNILRSTGNLSMERVMSDTPLGNKLVETMIERFDELADALQEPLEEIVLESPREPERDVTVSSSSERDRTRSKADAKLDKKERKRLKKDEKRERAARRRRRKHARESLLGQEFEHSLRRGTIGLAASRLRELQMQQMGGESQILNAMLEFAQSQRVAGEEPNQQLHLYADTHHLDTLDEVDEDQSSMTDGDANNDNNDDDDDDYVRDSNAHTPPENISTARHPRSPAANAARVHSPHPQHIRRLQKSNLSRGMSARALKFSGGGGASQPQLRRQSRSTSSLLGDSEDGETRKRSHSSISISDRPPVVGNDQRTSFEPFLAHDYVQRPHKAARTDEIRRPSAAPAAPPPFVTDNVTNEDIALLVSAMVDGDDAAVAQLLLPLTSDERVYLTECAFKRLMGLLDGGDGDNDRDEVNVEGKDRGYDDDDDEEGDGDENHERRQLVVTINSGSPELERQTRTRAVCTPTKSARSRARINSTKTRHTGRSGGDENLSNHIQSPISTEALLGCSNNGNANLSALSPFSPKRTPASASHTVAFSSPTSARTTFNDIVSSPLAPDPKSPFNRQAKSRIRLTQMDHLVGDIQTANRTVGLFDDNDDDGTPAQ